MGRAARTREEAVELFEASYQQDANGCWLWKGARTGSGPYGDISFGGERYAHRVSYLLHNGPIPARMVVRHRCDVPLCVNPEHLLLGTAADNMRDRAERGTYCKTGVMAAHGNEIRKLYETGNYTQHELAAKFGCTQGLISYVLKKVSA